MDQDDFNNIDRVVSLLANQFCFAHFTKEDLYQEGWKYALQALPSYKPESGPIDKFMYRAVKNGFLNISRNVRKRVTHDEQESELLKQRNDSKHKLLYPCSINPDVVAGLAAEQPVDDLAAAIRARLSPALMKLWLKAMEGQVLTKPQKNSLRAALGDLYERLNDE